MFRFSDECPILDSCVCQWGTKGFGSTRCPLWNPNGPKTHMVEWGLGEERRGLGVWGLWAGGCEGVGDNTNQDAVSDVFRGICREAGWGWAILI